MLAVNRAQRFMAMAACGLGLISVAACGRGSESLSASPSIRDLLYSDGIGTVRFGSSPADVRKSIDTLLGQAGGRYERGGTCGLDHQIRWWDHRAANGLPLLVAYFRRSKFAGYQYGDYGTMIPPHLPRQGVTLATARGLRIGDRLARGRRLYGQAFVASTAQGGTWGVRAPGGIVDGYAWTSPGRAIGSQSLVMTIGAGDVGCPAVSP
jgi:hypothetical protein